MHAAFGGPTGQHRAFLWAIMCRVIVSLMATIPDLCKELSHLL